MRMPTGVLLESSSRKPCTNLVAESWDLELPVQWRSLGYQARVHRIVNFWQLFYEIISWRGVQLKHASMEDAGKNR